MCLNPAYAEALAQVALLMALPFLLGLSAYLTDLVVERFFPDLEERLRRFLHLLLGED